MPILPINAKALIHAVDPRVNLDGLSEEQITQEASNVLKVCVQSFHQPLVRQDAGTDQFRASILKALGYRLDEIAPRQLNPTYESAVKSLITRHQRSAAKLKQPKRVMIALALPEHIGLEVLSHVPIANREQANNLHITLAYLGEFDSLPQQKKLLKLLSELGQWSWPIVGTISGIGRFNASSSSDWMDVVYATFDSPKLLALRDRILYILSLCKLEHKQNHGYTPHITLAYVPSGSQQPVICIPDTFVSFNNVSLFVDSNQHLIGLSGENDPADWLERTPELVGGGELEDREDTGNWVKDPKQFKGGYWQRQPDTLSPQVIQFTSENLPLLQVVKMHRFNQFELDKDKQALIGTTSTAQYVFNPVTGEEGIYQQPEIICPGRTAEMVAEVVASYIGRSSNTPVNEVKIVPIIYRNNFKLRSQIGGNLHLIPPGTPIEIGMNSTVLSPYMIQLGLMPMSAEMADRVWENSISHADLAKIAAFDLFVSNPDRTVANLYLEFPTQNIYAVDHKLAFMGHGPQNSFVPWVIAAVERWLERTDRLNLASASTIENFKIYRQHLHDLIDQHPYEQVIGQIMQTTKATLTDAEQMTAPPEDMDVEIKKRVSLFKRHHPKLLDLRNCINKIHLG